MGTPRPASGTGARAYATVKRELLVRYVDAWAPTALRAAKRVAVAFGYAGADVLPPATAEAVGDPAAVATLRALGEFSDRLFGKQLVLVLVESDESRWTVLEPRLREALVDLGDPPGLTIHYGRGRCDERLVPTLAEVAGARGPVFAVLDPPAGVAPAFDTVRAVAQGRHRELLITLDPPLLAGLANGDVDAATGDRLFGGPQWREVRDLPTSQRYGHLVTVYRRALHEAGLDFVTHVELVAEVDGPGRDTAQLLMYATTAVKHLEKFKDELWAVDECAGISYRDPLDEEHTVVPIAFHPQLAPLRRALLAAADRGVSTVADLRQYALTETMYRVVDANHALSHLVTAGALTRDDKGRLTADTRLTPRR